MIPFELVYRGQPVLPMTPEERAELITLRELSGSSSYPGLPQDHETILRLEATVRAGEKELRDLAKMVSTFFASKTPLEMEIRDVCHRLFMGPGVPAACCRCTGKRWEAPGRCSCDCHSAPHTLGEPE